MPEKKNRLLCYGILFRPFYTIPFNPVLNPWSVLYSKNNQIIMQHLYYSQLNLYFALSR
jgi:hypothetical protein